MSQNSLRSNLASARFPLLTSKMGRSIILPQYDENYDRTNQTNNEETLGKGIPQVYYMHNVMPTAEGYQSVGYSQKIAGVAGHDDFDQVFTLRDGDDNNFLYVPALGANYIYSAVLGAWQTTDPFTPGDVYNLTNISYAFIQGAHYICIEGQGVYQYDTGLNSLVAITFAGLTMTAIVGICASSGYMLCYDETTTYWSSVVDPLDFVPSLVTGAGSGNPADAKGRIITMLQISGGVIVYTTANAVSGQYTGNIRFPFSFKEVVGSGGIQSPEQISYTANFAEHYAITSSGLQKVDRNQATTVHDDVTDFLASQVYEDFDSPTQTFSVNKLANQVTTKLTLVSDRFLCISYGTNPGFTLPLVGNYASIPGTYASLLGSTYEDLALLARDPLNNLEYVIIYDLGLKRWGKLKFDHVDIFDYNWPNFFGTTPYAGLLGSTYASVIGTSYQQLSRQQRIAPKPKVSLALMQSDGAIWTIDFSEELEALDSVFVVGKYQMTRNRLFTLFMAEFDNVYTASPYSVYSLTSLDGKNNATPVLGTILASAANTAKAGFRTTGVNTSILLMGTFSLNTIVVNWTKHGQR